MFFFTTISDPTGLATMDSMVRNPERHYIAIKTGTPGTVAVRAQLGPDNPALPAVSSSGNSANGGASAPAGMISIYGTNLAKVISDPYDSRNTNTPGLNAWFGRNLPTSYNGTSVTIGGKKAPLLYVSPTQINAIVPLDAAAGSQPLIVSNSNGAGAAASTLIASGYAPAVFVAPTGAVVFKTKDGSFVSPSNPASAGDSLLVYATGFGQTTPALADGQITPPGAFGPATLITAKIGSADAPVTNSYAVPGFAGLYQLVITVPGGLTAGTAKLQLQGPIPALAIFGAPNNSTSVAVDIAIK